MYPAKTDSTNHARHKQFEKREREGQDLQDADDASVRIGEALKDMPDISLVKIMAAK